jgi:hypothetical protein
MVVFVFNESVLNAWTRVVNTPYTDQSLINPAGRLQKQAPGVVQLEGSDPISCKYLINGGFGRVLSHGVI